MLIDVTVVLKDVKGEPFYEMKKYPNPKYIGTQETPDEPLEHARKNDVTLRSVCVSVLDSIIKEDQGLSGQKKRDMGTLAQLINDKDNVDFKSEEITLLKKRIGQICSPVLIDKAWNILDPKSEDENEA
jgi:hypothetical protein